MKVENKNDGVQPVTVDPRDPEIETSATSSNPPLERTARPRKDKAGFHATKHGILARPLLEALVRRGENVRQLRAIERALKEDLRPDGILAEVLFDRMWSSYLRCLLISRTEARTLTSDSLPTPFAVHMPNFPEREKSTLSFDDISLIGLQRLALIQRYDSHFSRECFRAMGLLIAMRDGGNAGLSRQIEKILGKSKDGPLE